MLKVVFTKFKEAPQNFIQHHIFPGILAIFKFDYWMQFVICIFVIHGFSLEETRRLWFKMSPKNSHARNFTV